MFDRTAKRESRSMHASRWIVKSLAGLLMIASAAIAIPPPPGPPPADGAGASGSTKPIRPAAAARPVPVPPPPGAILLPAGQPLPTRGDQLALSAGQVLALERGGVYSGSLGTRASQIRIMAYGDAAKPAPKWRSEGTALTIIGAKEVLIEGIDFEGVEPRDGGIRIFNGSAWIRDCSVTNFRLGITAEGANNERGGLLKIERCRIYDNYSPKRQFAHGIYCGNVQQVIITDSVLDRNGWSPKGARSTIFNHNVYVRGDCGPVTATGNLFSRGSSHGLQARSGGVIEGNLFLENPIALSFGHVNGEGPICAGGVTGAVKDNIFIGGGEIDGTARGWALDVANVREAQITGNTFAHGTGGHADASAIRLVFCDLDKASYKGPEPVGIHNLTIENNTVIDWPNQAVLINKSLVADADGPMGMKAVKIGTNNFQPTRKAGNLRSAFAQDFYDRAHAGDITPGEAIERLRKLGGGK